MDTLLPARRARTLLRLTRWRWQYRRQGVNAPPGSHQLMVGLLQILGSRRNILVPEQLLRKLQTLVPRRGAQLRYLHESEPQR